MTPKKRNIRKWVDALRSGKYRQGYGRLYVDLGDGTPAKYCCLGVACEVAAQNGVDFSEESWQNRSLLPQPAMDWLGFDHSDPIVGTTAFGGNMRASSANDHHGLSFGSIADRVEKKYLSK